MGCEAWQGKSLNAKLTGQGTFRAEAFEWNGLDAKGEYHIRKLQEDVDGARKCHVVHTVNPCGDLVETCGGITLSSLDGVQPDSCYRFPRVKRRYARVEDEQLTEASNVKSVTV